MSKHLQKRLQALLAEEMDQMESLYAEDGARLLCKDDSGSDSGSGSPDNKNQGRARTCRELLNREGIDIGDTVVILTEGGTVITGVLVAEVGDRALRVLVTVGNGIPVNTLLIVDCRDIAAIGEVVDLGGV